MATVQSVVIDHGFPEYIEIISEEFAGTWVHWEDVADREALTWHLYKDCLEIEID